MFRVGGQLQRGREMNGNKTRDVKDTLSTSIHLKELGSTVQIAEVHSGV